MFENIFDRIREIDLHELVKLALKIPLSKVKENFLLLPIKYGRSCQSRILRPIQFLSQLWIVNAIKSSMNVFTKKSPSSPM